MRRLAATLLSFFVTAAMIRPAIACTSMLVTKGATKDGSTFITYSADSHELYGSLMVTPARDHLAGTTREIFDWDTGKRLGEIAEIAHTYAVVGNMNEHQLAIAESTFTGREELIDPLGKIDYGSLIYLALERAKTAREAIKVMTDLVAQYGYASSGESFSISDPNEAWILELIAKGPGVTGAVWVARRIPDGMISAHANQSRIRTFPLSGVDVMRASDVITFAKSKGFFAGKDEAFSFADAYAPLDDEALRFCEARVYSVFRRAAPSQKISSDYVMGKKDAQPLPLWIKPDQKLSLQDTMALMRDHFEGTPLDMRNDVGAGPYQLPYRFRPLTWEVAGKTYGNERAISTQQTGFSFVAQSRATLPAIIGGVLWFGVDDTYSTVYVPMYAGISKAPTPFDSTSGTFQRFSWEAAFWVFNFVSNMAYGRYSDMIVDIRRVQGELEGEFIANQAEREKNALRLQQGSTEAARAYLTAYSEESARLVTTRWKALGEALLVKYLDGNVRDETGKPQHPAYRDAWYARIVKDTGDHFLIHKEAKPKALPRTGYFHAREELGDLASVVPADFPFAKEKLVLVAGADKCARPPRCCVSAQTVGQTLMFVPPKEEGDRCGTPAWLVRVPKDEQRTLMHEAAEH